MKTLKTLIAAVLMTISLNSFASDGSSEKLKISYPLKVYVDAVAHGKIDGLSEVLDKDLKYTITRSDKIFNYKKSEILGSLSNQRNVEQNCTTEYRILETTPTQSLVKVILKYDGFSQISYLSLANTQKGWKITNIASSTI